MTVFTTFYLSRIIGNKVTDNHGNRIGFVKDILIETDATTYVSGQRPSVTGICIKSGNRIKYLDFKNFTIVKVNGKIKVSCSDQVPLSPETVENHLHLAAHVLDKQIVDLNGRKLVRVNDVRLVSLEIGTFTVAVDIGMEGLLRRIGIAKPIKSMLNRFGLTLPAKFILWEDVEAIDFSRFSIKLSKSYTKLHTLHPSDLADIIEDLGKKESTEVFLTLDEEKAADVLEELEPETQAYLLENMSLEKAADVLDKMPADEVADILDTLEEDKAEQLLNEMERETSDEVRELLDYPENSVGSIMSTEVLFFNENNSVSEVLSILRVERPESESLYNLFVTNENNELIATFSLRDLVVSYPETTIEQIMKPSPVYLTDDQKIDDIAEIISKYNLLAIPVVDKDNVLQGMVVIDDVIEDLMDERRTNK